MPHPLLATLYADVRRRLLSLPDEAGSVSRVLDAVCDALVEHAVVGLDGGATLPAVVVLDIEAPGSPRALAAALRTVGARAELGARLRNALPGLEGDEVEVLWHVAPGPRLVASVREETEVSVVGVRVELGGAGGHPWPARAFSLPTDRAALVGRGPSFEGDGYLPNDVVLPDVARFVSRGVGELRACGPRLLFRARPALLDACWRLDAGGRREPPDPVRAVLVLGLDDALLLTGGPGEHLLLRPLTALPHPPQSEVP